MASVSKIVNTAALRLLVLVLTISSLAHSQGGTQDTTPTASGDGYAAHQLVVPTDMPEFDSSTVREASGPGPIVAIPADMQLEILQPTAAPPGVPTTMAKRDITNTTLITVVTSYETASVMTLMPVDTEYTEYTEYTTSSTKTLMPIDTTDTAKSIALPTPIITAHTTAPGPVIYATHPPKPSTLSFVPPNEHQPYPEPSVVLMPGKGMRFR